MLEQADMLVENYSKISKLLEMDSEAAVQTCIDIHWGFERWVTDTNFNNKNFTTLDSFVTKGLFAINRFGIKLKEIHDQFDVSVSILMDLTPIFKKLWISIGIKFNKNQEKDDKSASQQKLYNHLNNIIMASWDDFKGLTYIEEMIKEKVEESSDKIHKIWSTFPSKTFQILRKSFKKTYASASSTMKKINSEANQNMIDNKLILFQINISKQNDYRSSKSLKSMKDAKDEKEEREKLTKKLENIERDEGKIIASLSDEKIKTLYKIGWTVNITGNKLINQYYKICKTWTVKTKVDVKVWIPCAEFCHAGHDLVDENTSFPKAVWSWGTHIYTNLSINSNKNPLYEIVGEERLKEDRCSMLKRE